MSAQRYEITRVKHVRQHLLRVTFGDGVEMLLDFAPWLHDAKRTSQDKRYRAVQWFKRVRNEGYALIWGDNTIGMYAEDLRKGSITGVQTIETRAAA